MEYRQKEYRQNVGICLINKDNFIFAGNRFTDNSREDGWQMPQGGVSDLDDEQILTSEMYRELEEETGITNDNVLILKKSHKVRYDFPGCIIENNKDKYKNIKGQEQIWFLLKFLGTDNDINLAKDLEHQEFFKWKWVSKDFLIDNIIEMKRAVYKDIFNFFAI